MRLRRSARDRHSLLCLPLQLVLPLAITVCCFPSVAGADEGIAEINQTCAIETGCFTGDLPGFPIDIAEAGSYRLTGNLTLSGAGSPVSMIQITGDNVTLDLGGFSIRCSDTGGGPCGGATSGITGSAQSATLRNGNISDMPGDGVKIAGSLHKAKNLKAVNNGGDGISLGDGEAFLGAGLYVGILVEDSVASGNGGIGIAVGRESLIRGCVSRANGNAGLSGTRTSTAPLITNSMSGYTESVVQLNGAFPAINVIDMGGNLCFDCP